MIKKFLRMIFFIFVVPFGLILGVLQLQFVHDHIRTYLVKTIEEKTGIEVEAEQTYLFLPFSLQARNVAIIQDGKPAVTIDHLAVHLSPFALVKGEITFRGIYLDGITVSKSEGGGQFPEPSWEMIPAKIRVHDLEINQLQIEGDEEPPINIKASGEINPKRQSFAAKISGWRTGEAPFSVGVSALQEQILNGGFSFTNDHLGSWSGSFELANLNNFNLSIKPENNPLLKGTLRAAVTLHDNGASLKLTSPQITFHDHTFSNLSSELAFASCGDRIGCATDTTFEDSHGIWNIAAALGRDGEGNLEITQLMVKAPHADIEGKLVVDGAFQHLRGVLKGEASDLSVFEPFLGSPLKGQARFETHWDHSEEQGQQLAIKLDTSATVFETVKLNDAKLNFEASHLFGTPAGHLELKADNLKYGDYTLTQVLLESHVDKNRELWPYTLTALGNIEGQFQLDMTGQWSTSPEKTVATVDTCLGKALGYSYSLEDPVTLTKTPSQFELSPILFLMEKGTFYATLDQIGDSIHTSFRVRNIPLDPIRLAFPSLAADGFISAEAFLFGSPENLKGHLQANLENIKIHEEVFAKLPPFQSQLTASLFDNEFECSGEIHGIGHEPIALQAKLPVTCSLLPPGITVDTEGDLYTHLTASGPVTPLLQLFAPHSTNMSGQLDVAINITGTPMQPHVVGYAVLKDGVYEAFSTGFLLQEIEAKLEGNGAQLVLSDLKGNDGRGGLLTGRGIIALDLDQKFPYELDLALNNIALVHLDTVSSNVSGEMTLAGDIKQGALSGEIRSDRLQMTPPKQKKDLMHALEIQYVNLSDSEEPPTQYVPEVSSWPLALNLTLNIPGNAFFTDDDLTSEWKGDLTVTGNTISPHIEGHLNAESGHYLFNGKKFEITKGTITFAGDPGKDTTLYVIGSLDIDRITAEIVVRGPINDPTIALRSTPPMPQRDILSWVLFNKGMSEITPFQNDQLSESVVDLSKANKNPDFITRLRDRFGIDKIDISHDERSENHDISVEVGKYLTDNTFISVKKNMTTEANQVCIGTNLISDFKLQAEVADDGTGAVNLLWHRDY